jgi:hypothetical protein
VFCIPTEASPETDADYTTHEVVPAATGMDPSIVADWKLCIESCAPDMLEAMVKDGLAAATEVKDREAFQVIRAAGHKRRAALEVPA